MRFLANENFPRAAVKVLEAGGHNVVWVRTVAPGAADPDVLALAVRERRILLTFDKDFGELAMPKPGDVGQQLTQLITSRQDWAGDFSVIETGRVRMRAFDNSVD